MNKQKLNMSFFARCYLPVSGNERQTFNFVFGDHAEFEDAQGNSLRLEGFDVNSGNTPQTETTRQEHEACVLRAIDAIQRGLFSKVIVSRVKHESRTALESADIVQRLCESYPNAFIYWISHPEWGEWIGATPELLLKKNGALFQTMALAGTLASGSNEIWDHKLAEEQKMVADFIENTVDSFSPRKKQIHGPFDLIAGPVRHLCTEYSFESDENVHAVVRALHPTPAVCGLPRESSRIFIQNTELHNRRLYTGYIGIDFPNGDALYWVNLRCMQVFADHFELFVGGGITSGSNPADEWTETERKSQVLLNNIRK
jgi:isochorismate synthase